MTVPKGKIVISGTIGVNLSTDLAGDPISINPDVAYGVMPKLDVGLYHSNYGITDFWYDGLVGGGICVSGDLCAEVYNGPTGILANYEIATGQMSLAAGGGLILTNVTDDADMGINIKAGADMRYALNDKMLIMASLNLFLNVSDRDVGTDQLHLPVGLMYAVNDKIHAGVQTGIQAADLGEIGDTYNVPLSLAGMMKIDEKLSVGGSLGFPFVVTAIDGLDAADFRTLALFGKYAL